MITPHLEQIHAQARDIARRLVNAATALPTATPRVNAASLLAQGAISHEIAHGAPCCRDDQLGLALMVAAELALHTRPGTPRAAAPHPR